MANTLTEIMPEIYSALDFVVRERVGATKVATLNADQNERAAKGQIIKYHVAEPVVGEDVTASNTVPNTGDQDIKARQLEITKARAYPVKWNGEEQRGLRNGDKAQLNSVVANQFAQAFRTAVNEIEADLCKAAVLGGSRAIGTAGTTPFNTADDLTDLAAVAKALTDNGISELDRHLVLDSTAIMNLQVKQKMLVKANESGSANTLRSGDFEPVFGLNIHGSAGIYSHTKGTGTGYLVNGALSAGATGIVTDTGSGTLVAGDIVTFAADSANKYIVNSGLASNQFVIGNPGLKQNIADNNAISIGNNYRGNFACVSNALHLVMRPIEVPTDGDLAIDSQLIQDPVSGLIFEVRVYPGYRQVRYEVSAAWGVAVAKPDGVITLLG